MQGPRPWTSARRTGIHYLFGLTGTKPLVAKLREIADTVATTRAVENLDGVRDFAEVRHKTKGWTRQRRAVARIEATRLALDIRFVVTNIEKVAPRIVYESLYCARGQAENLIKAHKAHLASDRTSCRRAVANQVRLVRHTAAYWLMQTLREAIPSMRDSTEPSSPPSGCAFSKSPSASRNMPPASVSPMLPDARTPMSSQDSPPPSNRGQPPRRLEKRGRQTPRQTLNSTPQRVQQVPTKAAPMAQPNNTPVAVCAIKAKTR